MARVGLANVATIDDLAWIARRRMPAIARGYLESGTGAELALARNRAALDAIVLTPRYMRDASQRSTATSLFGRDYDLPIGIAPVGLANALWPGADAMLAVAARAANVPYGLSTVGTTSIETIAGPAGGNLWFQLYVSRDEETTLDLVRRALDAGVEVLLVTIDVPVQSRRVRDIRSGFQLPFRIGARTALDLLRHPRWTLASARAGVPRFESLARYAPRRHGGAVAGALRGRAYQRRSQPAAAEAAARCLAGQVRDQRRAG